MVTVAILAILTTIAVPAYRSYVLQANRTDAIKTLTFDRQVLERCYSQNFSYQNLANDCPAAANIVGASVGGYYNITVPTWTATTYTLKAVPAGPQASDKSCQQFTVTQNGTQAAQDGSANNTTKTCWGSLN